MAAPRTGPVQSKIGGNPGNRPARILVLGSADRAGLSIARALGRQGYWVAVGSAGPGLSEYSRFVRVAYRYPSSLESSEAFAVEVVRRAAEWGIDGVFPAAESVVIALHQQRHLLPPHLHVALPEPAAAALVIDKARSIELAARAGVPHPVSRLIQEPSALAEGDLAARGPWVVKPRGLPLLSGETWPAGPKVRYAATASELADVVGTLFVAGCHPLVQEYVPGRNISHGLLARRGRILGLYQYEAVRSYPASGGVSCYHRTEPIDPTLAACTSRLMAALEWTGLAGVDYRVDSQLGRAWFLEVNGRAWAPIGAAQRSGQDFIGAACRLLLAGPDSPDPDVGMAFVSGQGTRYLRGELLALMSSGRGTLPASPPSWRTVAHQLRDSTLRCQGEIADLADPLPGLVEMGRLVRAMPGMFLRRKRE